MSGMYDMKPVRLSKRSSYVKFTDEMEQAMSSQRHLDLLRAPIIVTYGTHETPEFQRQNRDFAAAVKAAGKPVGGPRSGTNVNFYGTLFLSMRASLRHDRSRIVPARAHCQNCQKPA